MDSRTALIDRVASAPAWGAFPALEVAVSRWAELADAIGSGLIVSAAKVSMEWVAVRVTLAEPEGIVNFTEWLAPISFAAANQAALDHFAARSMATANNVIRNRGIGPRFPQDMPDPPTRPGPEAPTGERGIPMARKTTKAPEAPPPAQAKAAAKPGKAAPAKPGKAATAKAAPPEAKAEGPKKAAPKKSAPAARKATATKAAETRSAEPAASKPGKAAPKGRGAKAKSAR